MEREELFEKLTDCAVSAGAYRACVVRTEDVATDTSFRDLCAMNTCGNYGKCWTCPPDVGEIGDLIAALKSYEYMLVYQSVGMLEDSFDIEGMAAAALAHNILTDKVRGLLSGTGFSRSLYLCAGGCRICEICAKKTGEPCRHPDKAMPSLEAYGVNVSRLAALAGMKYINGQNTVTYFSGVLFDI